MLFFKAFDARGGPLHAPPAAPKFPRPKDEAEADWTKVEQYLKICSRGWHLAPSNWAGTNAWVQQRREVWLAEIAEGCTSLVDYHNDKFAVSEARLYRRLSVEEVGKIMAANQAVNPYDTARGRDISVTTAAWTAILLRPTGVTLKPGERQRLIDGANWFAGQRAKGQAATGDAAYEGGIKTHREVVLSVNL